VWDRKRNGKEDGNEGVEESEKVRERPGEE
jgi:hypothetical protein